MKGQKKLTRREMLKLSGTVVAGSVLAAACAPAVAPTPVPPTVAPTAVPPTVAPTKVPPTVAPTSAPAPAAAAGPVTLKLYDPTGAYEVTQLFSKRLDTLEGKTICELSNNGWEYDRTFPAIRGVLQKLYPTAKFIPYTEFGKIANADDVKAMQEQANKIKAAGCQAVIVGNSG